MKIKKIEKLNYARFHNYSWGADLDDFADSVNFLFGWNGSGKTTFSKVLRSIEIGDIEDDCSFKIQTDSSHITEIDDLSLIKNNIRVFNKDYIENTLRGSASIPYIFFAGEEAVSYDKEEEKLKSKKEEYDAIIVPNKHDDIASSTALVIKEVSGINSIKKELIGAGVYASYSKLDFEKRIKDIDEKITNGRIKTTKDLICSDMDSLKIQLVNSERFSRNNDEISEVAKWLIDNIESVNKTLGSNPVQIHSKRIDDLENDQVNWVEQGVKLHFNSKSLKKCLFCDSDIKNTEELIKHFSDEVVNAIGFIDEILKTIESYSASFAKMDSSSESQQKNISYIRSIFDSLSVSLKEKRAMISIPKKSFTLDIQKLNSMTNPESIDVASVAYAIESHYVAQKYDEYNREKQNHIKASESKLAIQGEISKLDAQIKELKQKVKNTHEPAQALNRLFKVVFPYRKIEITEAEDGKGYSLKRDNEECPFSSLSDGEKNFIALAYFIYSLNDTQKEFSNDGIVVIDDPVSSLDKQSIFQIFSIIVNEIKNNPTRQYLILTHNLDFLGHLKEHYRNRIGEGKINLYNFESKDGGCVINNIHPLLKKHRSDYYYIFTVLAEHKEFCDIADAHLIVNLLRRWLETFLEFKFSRSDDFRGMIEDAYKSAVDLTKDSMNQFSADPLEMYRFVNHGSHGFVDTETTDESILKGANERIGEIFELVKILDPLHYKKLEELI